MGDNPDGTGAQAEGGGTGGGLMSGAAGALLPLALGAASFMNPKAGSQMLQSLVPMLNLQQQETAFAATERERKLTREQQAAKDARERAASVAAGKYYGFPEEIAGAVPASNLVTMGGQQQQLTLQQLKEQRAETQRQAAGHILGAPLPETFTPPQPAESGIEEASLYAPRAPATSQERLSVLRKQREALAARPLQVMAQGLPVPQGESAAVTARIADIDKQMQRAGQVAPTEIAAAFASGDVSSLLTRVARDTPEHLGPAMEMARLIQSQHQPTRTIDEIALTEFPGNRKFGQLTMAERKTARGVEQLEAEKRAEATGRGQAMGTFQAHEDQAMNEKSAFWLDPVTGQPARPDQTPRQAKAAGMVPITQSGLNATASARAALTQIEKYEKLIPKLLPKSTGNIAADLLRVQGNRALIATKAAAGDPDARQFEALFGAIAILVRATGDNAGNVAAKEREFTQDFVMTPHDTQESAFAVMGQAKDIMKGVIRSRGLPVPDQQVPTQRPRPTGRPQ